MSKMGLKVLHDNQMDRNLLIKLFLHRLTIFSYRRAAARSEESMLFVFLFPLSYEIENPDVKHIL